MKQLLTFITYIIIYTLYTKESNHMDTKIFTWKPSDWGENHGSFTNFRIYFARFNPGWGNNSLQFT